MTTAPRPALETVVLRPQVVRVAGYAIGAVVLLASVACAILIPGFSIVDRLGFVAFGAGAAMFCHREASVRVVAEPERLVVRNMFATHVLDWPQVVGVSFPMGDPWAHLDLADGRTLPTNALQRADGARGIEAARTLVALVRERGEAQESPEA